MSEEKPMSVLGLELSNILVDLISKSQLPVFVIDLIFKDVYTNLHIAAQAKLKEDIENYERTSTKKEE